MNLVSLKMNSITVKLVFKDVLFVEIMLTDVFNVCQTLIETKILVTVLVKMVSWMTL